MRLVIILVAGTLSACATPAATGVATTSDRGDKICKRVAAIGSNVARSDCRTQEEWAAFDRQGKAGVSEFERLRDEVAAGQ